jgi:hypothetical protein
MNLDIQAIVDKKIAELTASKQIEALIEKGVEDAIENAIKESFSRYGSLATQIEKGLQEGLQVNFKEVDFDAYNAQMLVFIKGQINGLFESEITERFRKQIGNVIDTPPKEIEFTAFIEKILSFWRSDEEHGDSQTAHVEVGGNPSFQNRKTPSVKIWKDSDKTNYGADIELYIIDEKIRINHNQHYNPTCLSNVEAYLFNLYAAGTSIKNIHEFDEDKCDLCIYQNDWD